MTPGALMNAKEVAALLGIADRTFRKHRRLFDRYLLATNGIGRKKYSRAKVEAYPDKPVKKLKRAVLPKRAQASA